MATQTLLQLAGNAGLSPAELGAVEAVMISEELMPFLPVDTINGTTAYGYARRLGDVSASWVAPGGAYASAGGLKVGRILAETRKVFAQPDITPEDAARLGGAAGVHGQLAASAFVALGRTIADKAINGSAAPTATIDAESILVASTCVTAVATGGQHDLTQGTRGFVKFVTASDTFYYRAPGDVDWGDGVVIGASASGTVYSKNGENFLTITRGVGAIAADTTAVVTVANTAAEPDGLYKLMAPATRQWIYGGTNGGALTFELLDQLVDLCKGSGQKAMLTSKKIRRAIRKLQRDKATAETFMDVGAKKVPSYDGIPILVSDYVPTNRTRGSSGAVCSSIFCMTLGDRQGFRGVASTGIVDPAMQGARAIAQGPFGITCYGLPVSQTSDSIVDRAVGYMGFAQELVEGVAILDGLTYTG